MSLKSPRGQWVNIILFYFAEVYEVCELLLCEPEILLNALTQRTVETAGDRVTTDLSHTEVQKINS